MRPVSVVVVAVVGDESLELALVPDDHSVEQFAAQGSDPAFRKGVGYGGADGGREDLEAISSEDLVECVDELAAPISNQRPGVSQLVVLAQEQVATGLGGPGTGRVSSDAGEVTRDGGLGAQELGPGHGGAGGCGVDAVAFEDPPRRGRSNAVTKTAEFAVEAAVSPSWVLGSEVDDEMPDLGIGGRPPRGAGWLGPVSGDASAVPAKEGVGCDEPAVAAWPGECLGDGAEQRPVVIVQRGPVRLAAEYSESVAQDDDLEVSGAALFCGDAGQRSEEAVQDAVHTPQDRSTSALVNGHVRSFGHPQAPERSHLAC